MTEQTEKDIPAREEAPSPADEGKNGQHFRLLIVANRLPITIKKQPDVFLIPCRQLIVRAVTNIKYQRVVWQLHCPD
jgi:hypothetical protein